MITITNNNIYFTDFPISDYDNTDKLIKIKKKNLINYLSETVELGESVTFKRLFEIVSHNLVAFNEVFYSVLGGYVLDPFLQEIVNDKTDELNYDVLEIYWFCESYEGELNISPSIHGKINDETDDNAYALDFVSLNNIKDCVIKLINDVSLTTYNKKKVGYDTTELGEKSFSIFDLFGSIFYEITFHGGPQDKKEKFTDIEKTIKELENSDIEHDTFSSKSMEEFMEEFDSKDKYLVKYEDLRDRVDKDRISNEDNLDKLKKALIEKLKIYDKIENSKSDAKLQSYYKKITNIEYGLQLLYGEDEDINFHKFWNTPKCTCPKIDNIEKYPSTNPIFDEKCPIHKKVKNGKN